MIKLARIAVLALYLMIAVSVASFIIAGVTPAIVPWAAICIVVAALVVLLLDWM